MSDFVEPEPQDQEDHSDSFTPANPLSETEPKHLSKARKRELTRTVRMVDTDSAAAAASAVASSSSPDSQRNPYSATVRDAGAAMATSRDDAPSSCPKCHYPIAGNPETCPNCGTVLRRSTRKDASHAVAPQAPANSMHSTIREGSPQARAALSSRQAASFGKSTIRDIPRNLMPPEPQRLAPARDVQEAPQVTSSAETFRLVPLADTVTPVVYLREGDIVTIGGKRYRFVK